jgi:hypothetical protein
VVAALVAHLHVERLASRQRLGNRDGDGSGVGSPRSNHEGVPGDHDRRPGALRRVDRLVLPVEVGEARLDGSYAALEAVNELRDLLQSPLDRVCHGSGLLDS